MARLLLVPLFALLLVGCNSVFTDHPIGYPLDAEDDEGVSRSLSGVWALDGGTTNDGHAVIHTQYFGGGRLAFATVSYAETGFTVNESVAVITTNRDDDAPAAFLNLRHERDDGSIVYQPYRLAMTNAERALVLHIPNRDHFRALVAEGKAPGRIEGEDDDVQVFLTGTSEELAKLFDPAQAGDQFDLNSPIVYRRVADPAE